MDENTNSVQISYDSPKGQSSIIKVIGVGGGGGNAVNHMFKEGIEGVDFIVCNTDNKALNASPVPNKILLGNGLGTGKKPERARKAAEEKADEIRDAISHNTKMLFITAGMGGGTGTGAAPVIAKIAKSIELDDEQNNKILVVAIVTRPFSFEGKECLAQAEAGIDELSKYVDSIIVINNDKLRGYGNLVMSRAFSLADDVLLTAAKGIAEIITVDAYVNRDFNDINTVMGESGTALMGIGSGSGENRATDAIEAATTSVLLDDSDIRGAKHVLLYFTYNAEHEMTIDELTDITDYVHELTGGSGEVLWGAGPDASLNDELKVILIATGFEKSSPSDPIVTPFDDDLSLGESSKKETVVKKDEDGITVIRRTPSTEENTSFVSPSAEASTPSAEAVQQEVQKAAVENVPVQQYSEPKPTVEEPKAAPAAQVNKGEKIVHVLELEDCEDEEPHTIHRSYTPSSSHFPTEVDTMVEDIQILHPEGSTSQRPASNPVELYQAPAPADSIHTSSFYSGAYSKEEVANSVDRIRIVHDLLRSNPNGAEIVQSMTTSQISDEAIFEGQHSSARESSGVSIKSDGSIVKNPYVHLDVD